MKPSNQTLRKTRKRTGFTLIELMAAMAVFTILLVMLLRVFSGSVKAFNAGSGLSKQTTEARLVLDYIAGLVEDQYFDLKPSGSGLTSQLYLMNDLCAHNASIRIGAVPGTNGSVDDTITLIQEEIFNGNPVNTVPLLDHVLDFEVSVYDESMIPGAGGTPTLTGLDEYTHDVSSPSGVVGGCTNSPILAVIYLETLDDQNAKINRSATNEGVTYNAGLKSQKYYRTVYLRNFLSQ